MSAAPWRNRIVGQGTEAPDQLLASPSNWRIHPRAQQDALSGVLAEIGWIQNVIVNRTTGHVVDGHLRVELAISRREPSIPVVYVELTEAEEQLALATLDPLSALAVTDAQMLGDLLAGLETENEAVRALLDGIAQNEGITPPNFDPVGLDEQGRLDEKKPVTCPHCGGVFSV